MLSFLLLLALFALLLMSLVLFLLGACTFLFSLYAQNRMWRYFDKTQEASDAGEFDHARWYWKKNDEWATLNNWSFLISMILLVVGMSGVGMSCAFLDTYSTTLSETHE